VTTHPLVVVVTGVSGSGKSTVGAALAERLGWAFFDGDDFHPQANVDKMRRGIALDDTDRAPWLERLHDLVRTRVDMGAPAVLACSALKRSYRAALRVGLPHDVVRFVHLDVDAETLAARLGGRRGHYMPASLLASQLATLEVPTPAEALVVDGGRPVAVIIDELYASLRGRS
jgi:carbohydrate kinase (thermoresistant glucokinase family)